MKINKHESRLLSFWVALCLIAGFLSPALALAVTAPPIPPAKDSWVSQVDPATNNGASSIILVDSSLGKNDRGLLDFDLSSIPAGATITSAQMSMFLFSTTTPESPRVYDLFDINNSWDEATVTWNNQPGIGATIVSSEPISTTTTGNLITWDVTSEISKFILNPASNFGWMIKDSQEDSTTAESKASYFWSKDNTPASLRVIPELVVTYTLPSASISGEVFNDLNSDGLISAGEAGLSGWTVSLSGTSASSTVTDSSGQYSFGNLSDGSYQVCETPASSTPPWMQTSPLSGFACGAGLFGHDVTISSGASVTGQNFGNILSSVAPSTTTPAVPALLLPANASTVDPTGGITLDWADVTVSASSTPVSYFFQIATTSATTTQNSLVTLTATSSALAISQAPLPALPDGAYFWQARACDASLNCSSWSDPFSFTQKTPAPSSSVSGLTGGGGGGNGPIVGSLSSASFPANTSVVTVDSTGAGSGTSGSSGSVSNSGGGGESALVPPATSGQTSPEAPQNNISGNAIVAQNSPSGNTGSNAYTVPPETATTSAGQSNPQSSDNSSQVAAAGTSTSFFTTGFWIWALIILIVIVLIIYFFSRSGDSE